MTDQNETTKRAPDLKDFEKDLDNLVNLTAAVEAAKDALNEAAKEMQEKYEEHESLSFKAAANKKMASIILKDSLNEERDKAMLIFDMVENVLDDKQG